MGGKSKKQTIGYKYYLGQHLVMCHGPIDAITRATVDDRLAWQGESTGGSITVNAPELFGGESREGGVSGTIDIEMGGPAQGQNSYLLSKLGALIPAYRGVVGAVFRQCYLGNNPYLKAWRFRGQRIHVRQNGLEQWYDETSSIAGGDVYNRILVDDTWEYQRVAVFTPSDPSSVVIPEVGYATGQAPFGNNGVGTPPGNTLWDKQEGLWLRKTIDPAAAFNLNVKVENACYVYVDGVYIGGVNPSNADAAGYPSGNFLVQGSVLHVLAVDELSDKGGGDNVYIRLTSSGGSSFNDMNPAHIIRECLTDPDWGMGYTDNDIDETSFLAAADTFYAEGMGISLLWDKQIKLEEFVEEIKKHADAALYVSRTSGKFVLKPIRDDYDPGSLIVLDESNISRIDDPSRTSSGELVNSVTVNYWDALTGKDASLTVTDTALVQVQGAVINTTIQYPGFTNARNATVAAQRDLRALSSPTLSCTIYTDSTAKALNVGDAFKLSWARWGLSEVVMRVTGIAYGTGRSNVIRINCVEDVYETRTNIVVSVPGNDWTDPSAAPESPEYQLAVEAPYYEVVQVLGQTDTDTKLAVNPEVGFVLSAVSRAPGGINARMWSDSGAGYEDTGALDFSPYGELLATITKTQTSFTLTNYSDLDEIVVGTHFQIDDELLRVDAVDTGTGVVTCGRGVLDTVPAEHLIGAPVLFWDQYAGFDPSEYVDGEEVDVKVTAVSGAGTQDLGDVAAIPVTLDQRAARPYPPGNFQLNGESYAINPTYLGSVTATWTHRDRTQQTSGTILDHTAGDIGPEAGTLYRLQGYVDDILVHTEDDIAGTSASWNPGVSSPNVRIEVHSKRDGLYSWQAPSHTFSTVSAGARITEDGDTRVTEDGDTRFSE